MCLGVSRNTHSQWLLWWLVSQSSNFLQDFAKSYLDFAKKCFSLVFGKMCVGMATCAHYMHIILWYIYISWKWIYVQIHFSILKSQ